MMNGDAIHVRVPLSPATVRAIRKHVENFSELARLLKDATATAEAIAGAYERASAEIVRDVARVRRKPARRRKVQR